VLGPPLGQLLSPARETYAFLPLAIDHVHPEPTEHARYLIAICAPLLAALATATAPRWLARVPAGAVAPAVVAAQLAVAGVVVASIVGQYRMHFGLIYTRGESTTTAHLFTPATLAVATLLAASAAGAIRVERVRARLAAGLGADSRRRRLAVGAVAAAATAIWMLHAVHSDSEIASAPGDVLYHLGFTLDETFAMLNGRTPLVDFTAQYGSLWPYAPALAMLVLGKTVLTFTLVLCSISALALFAVYDVLRRVTRSAVAALLLYLPFLATSLFHITGTLQSRSTPATYYGNFPLPYALPYLLAWLTARRIERGGGARAPCCCSPSPGSRCSTTATSAPPRSARLPRRCCGPPSGSIAARCYASAAAPPPASRPRSRSSRC
jgi:hypothetical protein